LTCTYLAKRLRELSSTKTGSYPHEFLCRTNCSACAYYQPCLGTRVAQWIRSLDLTTHTSLSPIRRVFKPVFVNYKKRCTRLACAAASDKVYQLLAHGRWFSPGTPASSTTKSGRHDIAEILLKVALKHQIKKNNQNKLLFINRSLFRTSFFNA
jgi:hypothetical protein